MGHAGDTGAPDAGVWYNARMRPGPLPATHDAPDPRDAARPRVVTPLVRLLLAIFFRDIEVVGASRVPRSGGVVFAANHVNALIDPALLLATMPRSPRFLAKSTLWHMPVVRPFLELAAAIPVYRRQDGADPADNAEMFARCHRALAAGGAIALFPEGTSHNEPALVPLKTGISRIVLEAEARFGGIGSRIVPVGLTFEDKGRFRSRALVTVGQPLDPAPYLAAYAAEPRETVRALTERVRAALAAVTLNYPSWREARLIERAAELYARPHAELPAEDSLEARFATRKAFIDGYRALAARAPQQVARTAAAVEAYDELLGLYRLRDAQVAAAYPPARVWRFVSKSLGLLLVRLPLALLGTAINALPYAAVAWLARRPHRSADVLATYKLFGSLVFYPLTWAALALAVGFLHAAAGLAMLALGPLSALVALRFHERRGHFRREARAYLLLRSGRRSMAELRRRRAAVLAAVQALAAEHRPADAGVEGDTAAGDAPG